MAGPMCPLFRSSTVYYIPFLQKLCELHLKPNLSQSHFLYQLEVGERLDRLEELTTDTQDLGTTEVIISVSILVNTTDFVLQNDSVIKYNYFHDELLLY